MLDLAAPMPTSQVALCAHWCVSGRSLAWKTFHQCCETLLVGQKNGGFRL